MKSIGSTLFIIGIGSMILPFLNMEFAFLGWMDNWGPTVRWLICGGAAVAGGVLWFLGNKAEGATD